MSARLRPLILAFGLAALACGDPVTTTTPSPPDAGDVKTPPPPEDPTERPPPGGWIADGVIYDRDGSVYGCVGGGNACAGPPAAFAAEGPLDLCGDVDAIRDAELDWQEKHGAWKRVAPTPRAAAAIDETAVAWPKGSGFDALGWSPGAATRATYWVDTPDGGGFEVHGLAKVDGAYAHCFASEGQGAVDTPWRTR